MSPLALRLIFPRQTMSTPTIPATQSTPIKSELGPTMTGADILVEALEREGVEAIFAYPGGASMELHQDRKSVV